jgi:phospholipid/cholesterol/gamma-HCH transport system permease protein
MTDGQAIEKAPNETSLADHVAGLGGRLLGVLTLLGEIGIFGARVVTTILSGKMPAGAFVFQLYTVSRRCFLPVVAVVFPFGMVMALQGLKIFAFYGTERMLSALVAAAIIRELSPVLSSTLVAAQGGASCAAELGAMRIKEEIDATDVMAVDSIAFHVAPRFLALVVAAPLLNVMGTLSGIFGGWVSAVLVKGEPHGTFMAELWGLTRPLDIWTSFFKTGVFGAIIGLLGCWLGYTTTGGAAGVGRAVNLTVVWSVLVFIAANYLLTSAIFGGLS